jgi:hypothetical protein
VRPSSLFAYLDLPLIAAAPAHCCGGDPRATCGAWQDNPRYILVARPPPAGLAGPVTARHFKVSGLACPLLFWPVNSDCVPIRHRAGGDRGRFGAHHGWAMVLTMAITAAAELAPAVGILVGLLIVSALSLIGMADTNVSP